MTPEARIGDALGVRPVSSRRVSGGCISEARRVELVDGTVVFAKTHSAAAPEMFPAEAAGLRALAAASGHTPFEIAPGANHPQPARPEAPATLQV